MTRPVEALRKLVDALTVNNRADTFKPRPMTNLREQLKKITGDGESDEKLKELATRISPLLSDEVGAKERKSQMLACFPATTLMPTASETSATAEAR